MKTTVWKKRTIADIGRFLGGATPQTSVPAYWNGQIHWTTSKRIGNSVFLESGERFITKLGLDNSSTSLVPKGNLLIGTRVGVGKVVVNTVDMAISQDLTGVVVDREKFNPVFLAFCISQPDIQTRFTQQARGVTIKGIPREDLKQVAFDAPEISEQETIAAVLWKVQRAIQAEDKLVATTRELKQSAMRQLFTHGLRREKLHDTEIGSMPSSWQPVALGSLGRIGNGSTPLKTNPAYWTGGAIPWLTSAKVYDVTVTKADQFVTPLAVAECHLPHVKPGSVLIAITGQGKTLGHAAVTAIETCVSQHIAFLMFDDDSNNPHFFRLFLESRYAQLRGVALGGGSTKGALTCGFLKSYLAPHPKRDEQDEIASALMTIESKISVHERKRAALSDLFQTLLHQLMTAQIRVDKLAIDTSELAALSPSPRCGVGGALGRGPGCHSPIVNRQS